MKITKNYAHYREPGTSVLRKNFSLRLPLALAEKLAAHALQHRTTINDLLTRMIAEEVWSPDSKED